MNGMLTNPWLPVAVFASAVITLTISTSITLGGGEYIGGIVWPYFSDTGRESPAYEVFAVGLTLAGLGWVALVLGERRIVAGIAAGTGVSSAHVARLNVSAPVCGVLAAACVSLLAIFDTINYPTIHNLAAYVFFLSAVAYVGQLAACFQLLARRAPEESAIARSFRMKVRADACARRGRRRLNKAKLFGLILVPTSRPRRSA